MNDVKKKKLTYSSRNRIVDEWRQKNKNKNLHQWLEMAHFEVLCKIKKKKKHRLINKIKFQYQSLDLINLGKAKYLGVLSWEEDEEEEKEEDEYR